jgi:CRISPR-associated protein Cas2
MHVLILQSVPAGVRGEIGKWLVEPFPGVFVGHLSARVRDLLWTKCINDQRIKGVVQIWQTNNEQRFAMRGHGVLRRDVVDIEGITLVRIPEIRAENVKGNVTEE